MQNLMSEMENWRYGMLNDTVNQAVSNVHKPAQAQTLTKLASSSSSKNVNAVSVPVRASNPVMPSHVMQQGSVKSGSAQNVSQSAILSTLMHNQGALLGGMQKQALGTAATSAIGAGIGGLAGYLLGRKDDKLFSTLTGAGIGALGGYGVGRYMNPSAPAATTTTTTPTPTETATPTEASTPSATGGGGLLPPGSPNRATAGGVTNLTGEKVPVPKFAPLSSTDLETDAGKNLNWSQVAAQTDAELQNAAYANSDRVNKIQSNPNYTPQEKKELIAVENARTRRKMDFLQRKKDRALLLTQGGANANWANYMAGTDWAEEHWGDNWFTRNVAGPLIGEVNALRHWHSLDESPSMPMDLSQSDEVPSPEGWASQKDRGAAWSTFIPNNRRLTEAGNNYVEHLISDEGKAVSDAINMALQNPDYYENLSGKLTPKGEKAIKETMSLYNLTEEQAIARLHRVIKNPYQLRQYIYE